MDKTYVAVLYHAPERGYLIGNFSTPERAKQACEADYQDQHEADDPVPPLVFTADPHAPSGHYVEEAGDDAGEFMYIVEACTLDGSGDSGQMEQPGRNERRAQPRRLQQICDDAEQLLRGAALDYAPVDAGRVAKLAALVREAYDAGSHDTWAELKAEVDEETARRHRMGYPAD